MIDFINGLTWWRLLLLALTLLTLVPFLLQYLLVLVKGGFANLWLLWIGLAAGFVLVVSL